MGPSRVARRPLPVRHQPRRQLAWLLHPRPELGHADLRRRRERRKRRRHRGWATRARSVSPDGNHVYASPNDNGVAVFSRNSTTCAPTFLELAQDLFTLGQPSVDSIQGTATLPVSVDTGGALDVSVAPVTAQGSSIRRTARDPHAIQVSQAGVVNVPVSLDSQQAQELDALHQLSVKATITFTASGGTPTTKALDLQLSKRRPVSSSTCPHRRSRSPGAR